MELARPYDLVVVGDINPDLVLQGDVQPAFGQAETLVEGASLRPGASAVIVACGAARLGLRTALLGLVGDDLFGRFMLDALQARGVDTAGCAVERQRATGLSVILSRAQDRAILTFAGSNAELRFGDLDLGRLASARHLHVSSYFLLDELRPDVPRLFREAKRLGLTTSLDTNWDPGGGWTVPAEVLAHVDVLLPNEQEALRLAGEARLEPALDSLSRQVRLLAVKLGPEGGLVRQGSLQLAAPALAVEAVDATGAGDSFDAGFLYGYLKGWPLERSLRLACVCGSLSTRGRGGTERQPTLAEAEPYLEQPSPPLASDRARL